MLQRSRFYLNSASFAYNFALNMFVILVPLYVLSQGASPVILGLIVSAQGLSQPLLRLFGGIFSDQFGERTILRWSLGSLLLSAFIYFLSQNVWAMVIAQLITGASRSVFYSASQSYASRIDPARARVDLGVLAGYINVGNVAGSLAGGFLAQYTGYKIAFGIALCVAASAYLTILYLPELPMRRKAKAVVSVVSVLRVRPLYLAGAAAFAAATPFVLMGSFYPSFYQHLGYEEWLISLLVAGNMLGLALAGFIFYFIQRLFSNRWLFFLGFAGTGLLIVISPMFVHAFVQSLILFIMGVTSGLANMFYQFVSTEYSAPEERGVAMSVSGFFWAIANLCVPATFGLLVSIAGLAESFWISGGVFLAMGFLTPMLFLWLMPRDSSFAGKNRPGKLTAGNIP